jgi:hypothetical protein
MPALIAAGHWITTDSGQHILILPGHGTTKEQVAAHFKSKGQPNHPDVGKAVVHHRGGFDPEKANRGISTRNGAEAMQVRIKGHEEAGKGKPSKPEGKAPAKEPASSKSPDTARADRLKRLNSKLPPEQTKTVRERAAEMKASKRAVDQGRAEKIASKPKEEAKPTPAETTTSRLAGAPSKMTLRERAAMKARPKAVEAETPAAKPSMTLREKIASRKAEASKPGSESFREGRVSDRAWERGQKLRAAGKGEEAEAEFSRHDRMMRRLYHKTPEGQAVEAKAGIDPASHINHPPETVTALNTNLVHFDPDRFQYKLGAQGEHGVTDALKGTQAWDPNAGTGILVWKDPEAGKVFVINGHHRLDIAKKLGVPQVETRFITAKNAEEARLIGATTNIKQGRGTSVDAAKVFRESGLTREALIAGGMPMKEKIASEGLALANLHEPIFKKVVNGDLSVPRGVMIGEGLSHPEQIGVMKIIDKHKNITDATLREAIEHERLAPKTVKTTHSLFGDDEEVVSLGLHRAETAAFVHDRLLHEKKVFGTVSKERNASELQSRAGNIINAEESGKISQAATENLATFRMLKDRSSPVSHLLNEAATRKAAGESKKVVHADVYNRLPEAIRASLAGG